MSDFLAYDLKVAVLIIVFHMFYRLLLSHETFHRVNRIVLLLTAIASFVLPLCVITTHRTVAASMAGVAVGDVPPAVAAEAEPAPSPWQVALSAIYIIGMAATLGRTLLSLVRVWQLIRRSERHPQPDGTTLCVVGDAAVAPFSWMRYIVMNRGDYAAHDAAILAHERGHVRLRHSLDVVLVDLLTALQWFNPAMWMLRHDLRAIHEYEADGEVLSQGIDARQYQYLLISKAVSIGGYSIANGISHSTLKNRIHMMTNKKSKSSHLMKLLALLPIVGAALALNARTITDYVYDGPRQQPSSSATHQLQAVGSDAGSQALETNPSLYGKTAEMSGVVEEKGIGETVVGDTIQTDSPKTGGRKVYDVVDQMPKFPGGPGAMMQYVSDNIRYPEEAYKQGQEGRVIVSFVVESDGSLSDVCIVRGASAPLDAEAIRVVSTMPQWTPGRQYGEPVAVKYTMPLVFKIK